MKKTLRTLVTAALAALALALSGCGEGGPGKTKMDTKAFTAAFAGADAALSGPATEAVAALNSGKMFEGTTALVALAKAGAGKFSEPQKNALINLGATIQMIMAEDGDKADLKVYQAVEDLMAAVDIRSTPGAGAAPGSPAPAKAK